MLALRETGARVVIIGLEQVRIPAYRLLELALGLVVALAQRDGETARRVRLRQLGIELQRAPAGLVRSLQIFRSVVEVHEQVGVAIGRARVRQREVGIFGGRPPEHLQRELDALALGLVEVLATAKVMLVGLDVGRGHLAHGPPGALIHLHLQRLNDAPGNLRLDREHVLQLPIVLPRPQMVAVGHVDELSRDADPVAGLANAALQNRVDVELAPDRTHVLGVALESECRGT